MTWLLVLLLGAAPKVPIIFVVSCTITWTEYDQTVHTAHVPFWAYKTEARAKAGVSYQNAAHNPWANQCDYARVELR